MARRDKLVLLQKNSWPNQIQNSCELPFKGATLCETNSKQQTKTRMLNPLLILLAALSECVCQQYEWNCVGCRWLETILSIKYRIKPNSSHLFFSNDDLSLCSVSKPFIKDESLLLIREFAEMHKFWDSLTTLLCPVWGVATPLPPC